MNPQILEIPQVVRVGGGVRVEHSLCVRGGACARPTPSLTFWDSLLVEIFR